ncbi:MAG TPA: hypothetical protein VJS65_05270 [Verrucomicrobiae bacterium]|nr:hypothetical protein [Verrucomicrobiae bacterium]
MNKILKFLALAGAMTCFGAVSSILAAPPQTGLQGQAFLYISYGTPIEIEPGLWVGIPDVQMPVATSFTIVSARNGREVGRITTDAGGLYSVSLVPGKYVVVPDPLNLHHLFSCPSSTTPFEVTVRAKQMAPANIFYYREGPCSVVIGPPGIVPH